MIMANHRFRSFFPLLCAIGLAALSGVFFPGGAGAEPECAGLGQAMADSAKERVFAISPPGTIAHDIRPGPAVSSVLRLSDYLSALAGTPADSLVYILDSGLPGATTFVSAGTHANEIAGMMAAVMLVEKARVAEGRLIVLPHANNSGVSYPDPAKPGPDWILLATASGETRRFKYGARLLSPAHQTEPDPRVFAHSPGQTEQAGSEARNLDRAYPGQADGTLTQKLAFAIMTLLLREKVDYAFDFHEAGPSSNLVWTVVANPKNLDVAALALLDLDDRGISLKLDASAPGFRGISHYEWGNLTPALAFLIETPNPGQIFGAPETLQIDHPTLPLWRRIGAQLEVFSGILSTCGDFGPSGRRTAISGLPSMADLQRDGLGRYY
jgi:hypothetical protein